MSNVGYRCPEKGCQNAHFGPPGGTRQKCRPHDKTMVQAEFYNDGADLATDEGSAEFRQQVEAEHADHAAGHHVLDA